MAQQQTSPVTWALIAGACLVLGITVGYVLSGGQRAAAPAAAAGVPAAAAPAPAAANEQQVQALRDILARDPRNLQANTQLGNMLYDAGRYAEAVPAYQAAFAMSPRNVNLSTDLATALWYSGRTDEALAQFDRALAIDPTHPQTLFNLGIVRRDGKHDLAGAVAAWEKLLAANPNYVDRDKVRQLLAEARAQLGAAPAK